VLGAGVLVPGAAFCFASHWRASATTSVAGRSGITNSVGARVSPKRSSSSKPAFNPNREWSGKAATNAAVAQPFLSSRVAAVCAPGGSR
jgi:hypothetical protein